MNSRDYLLNLGNALFEEGKLDKAIENYNEVIRLDPEDALAYAARGCAYFAQHNFTAAIDDYSKTIQLDPNLFAYIYGLRGKAYLRQSNLIAAINDLNEVMRLDPKFMTDETNKTHDDIYKKLGGFTGVIKAYSDLIFSNPNDASAYYNRGVAYQKNKTVPMHTHVATTMNSVINIVKSFYSHDAKNAPSESKKETVPDNLRKEAVDDYIQAIIIDFDTYAPRLQNNTAFKKAFTQYAKNNINNFDNNVLYTNLYQHPWEKIKPLLESEEAATEIQSSLTKWKDCITDSAQKLPPEISQCVMSFFVPNSYLNKNNNTATQTNNGSLSSNTASSTRQEMKLER